jgi:hypothetical protein
MIACDEDAFGLSRGASNVNVDHEHVTGLTFERDDAVSCRSGSSINHDMRIVGRNLQRVRDGCWSR